MKHSPVLYLLEVEFWEHMKPVGELRYVEKLEHEGHVDVWVIFPEQANVEEVFPEEDVAGPKERHKVEGKQLAGFVELDVLDLGQVKLPINFVK